MFAIQARPVFPVIFAGIIQTLPVIGTKDIFFPLYMQRIGIRLHGAPPITYFPEYEAGQFLCLVFQVGVETPSISAGREGKVFKVIYCGLS